jgi:hypothetical protein
MAPEQKYQRGDFDNRSQGRNPDDDVPERDSESDFEVTRRQLHDQRPSPDGQFRREGSHTGKGPRNYQRRDERILEEINDRMCDNAYLDASEIDVSVSGGNVVLAGTVENRESKRLAEDIAESVSGVRNVENTLRVTKRGI